MSDSNPKPAEIAPAELPPAEVPAAKVPRGKAAWYKHAGNASIGIEMAAAIAIGTGVGIWLENNVTFWKPWTMIIGFFVGCGAAAAAVVRVVMEIEADRRAKAELPPSASGPDAEASTIAQRDAPPPGDAHT